MPMFYYLHTGLYAYVLLLTYWTACLCLLGSGKPRHKGCADVGGTSSWKQTRAREDLSRANRKLYPATDEHQGDSTVYHMNIYIYHMNISHVNISHRYHMNMSHDCHMTIAEIYYMIT